MTNQTKTDRTEGLSIEQIISREDKETRKWVTETIDAALSSKEDE